MKYVCDVCGWEYDEEKGYPEGGICLLYTSKLKVYQITVLVMTLFLVLVALISTVVIRSNIEKITKAVSYTHLMLLDKISF